MNISELFIRRPVLSTLSMVATIIFGFISYKNLPISVLPNVDFPTIVVSSSMPGADPTNMASSVALPLEKQFSSINGIDTMSSLNTSGSSQITIQFGLDRNIDAAAQDVQSAIASSANQLPNDLPNPPSYKKANPADMPIFYLAMTSETMPLSTVDYYAETIIAEKLSMLKGVAQVQIYGAQVYAVRIQLDPNKLASYSIGIGDVRSFISSNNVNNPTGSLYGNDIYTTIKAPGQLLNAEKFNNLILTYRDGKPVYLKNIGIAIDDVANNKLAAWYKDKRGIIIAIQKQPNTNTIAVVNAVKALLPELNKQIPNGIESHILFDRSDSIKESVDDVKFTLILALILVVIVIYIFLQDIKSTIIPSFALPLSIIGTFAVMYLCGYSIDNLSLMALTLGVGFVVDDAIVVLENIIRHLEQGKPKLEACLDGSKEIMFTVVSMTLSLIAVFIPLLFMGGILGRLLHEFAVTITATILISGIVSVTVTPMLCHLFLSDKPHTIDHQSQPITERIFEYIKNQYDKTLKIVLLYRKTTMLIFCLTIIATLYFFKEVPKGFLPTEDTGQIICTTEAVQNISFKAMVREQQKASEILLKNPYVESFMSAVGAGGRNSSINQGTLFLRLKPRDQRPNSTKVIEELRKELSVVSGMKFYMQNVATITVGAQSSKSQYQYTLQGVDQDELFDYSQKLQVLMNSIKGLVDITSDLQISQPQVLIDVDRHKASELGISMEQVQNTLYLSYGAQQISTIYTSTNQYQVILELQDQYQIDPSMLKLLYVKSQSGELVPMEAIAKISNQVGPLSISHFGQLPSVTISFNVKAGYSLGKLIPEIENIIQQSNMPSSITGGFQGTAKALQSSSYDSAVLMLIAIFVIYLLLGILYESFIHPITILSGLPTAGFGALITLIIFGKELDMYGFVGLIMLIGIVKKNAIMIIDFALEAERSGTINPEEAVYQACLIRFRPIVMTSLAALMGALPIALAIGPTGPQRSSLGLSVVGGLMTSQILTLYITPVIFLYFEQLKHYMMTKIKIKLF